MTLLSFLKTHNTLKTSVKNLKKAVDHKQCKVNGQIETISTRKLKIRDTVFLADSFLEKQEEITILYEDTELVICNKPSGILSDAEVLMKKLPKRVGKLILVHRLDKETSGVIILAKKQKIYEQMVEIFSKREIKKEYIALVSGRFEKGEGEIIRPIGVKKRLPHQTLYGVMPHGKEAITRWKCLKSTSKISSLSCELVTGRTHQLRVHLSSIGHPILGDALYGKIEDYPRLMLHAYRICFPHPVTGSIIEVRAPLPSCFKEGISSLL